MENLFKNCPSISEIKWDFNTDNILCAVVIDTHEKVKYCKLNNIEYFFEKVMWRVMAFAKKSEHPILFS